MRTILLKELRGMFNSLRLDDKSLLVAKFVVPVEYFVVIWQFLAFRYSLYSDLGWSCVVGTYCNLL